MVDPHGFPCTGQRRTDGEGVSDFSNMCYLNSSGNPQLASCYPRSSVSLTSQAGWRGNLTSSNYITTRSTCPSFSEKYLSDLPLPLFSPYSYFLDFFAGVGDGSLHLDAVHSSPSLSRSRCCCRIEKSA